MRRTVVAASERKSTGSERKTQTTPSPTLSQRSPSHGWHVMRSTMKLVDPAHHHNVIDSSSRKMDPEAARKHRNPDQSSPGSSVSKTSVKNDSPSTSTSRDERRAHGSVIHPSQKGIHLQGSKLALAHDLKNSSTVANLMKNTAFEKGINESDDHQSSGATQEYVEDKTIPQKIVASQWFNGLLAAVIVLNTIQIGMETDYPEYEELYFVLENLSAAFFVSEMVLKLVALKLMYFHDRWNLFDFCLVLLSVTDTWILRHLGGEASLKNASILRVVRVMRVARMVRMLRALRELWLIIRGIIDSVRPIFWALLLLAMLLYVSAIFCVQMVGRVNAGEVLNDDFEVDRYYGTIPRAMYTLLETSIEPLNIRPVVEQHPHMIIFFLMFIFLTTFGVMNVIIGVMVENTMEAARDSERDQEQLKQLRMVDEAYTSVELFDLNANGVVSLAEFAEGLKNPEVEELLGDMALPIGCTIEEVFDLLNEEGRQSIATANLAKQLVRANCHNDKQNFFDMLVRINRLNKNVNLNEENQQRRHASLIQEFEEFRSFREDVDFRLGKIERVLKKIAGEVDEAPDICRHHKNHHGVAADPDKDPMFVKCAAPDVSKHHDDHRKVGPSENVVHISNCQIHKDIRFHDTFDKAPDISGEAIRSIRSTKVELSAAKRNDLPVDNPHPVRPPCSQEAMTRRSPIEDCSTSTETTTLAPALALPPPITDSVPRSSPRSSPRFIGSWEDKSQDMSAAPVRLPEAPVSSEIPMRTSSAKGLSTIPQHSPGTVVSNSCEQVRTPMYMRCSPRSQAPFSSATGQEPRGVQKLLEASPDLFDEFLALEGEGHLKTSQSGNLKKEPCRKKEVSVI